MRESYTGLFTGIALAIILVYLFLVMNFQSWIDPLDRADGGAVCPGRGAVDAVPVANPDERAGADGHAHVHRVDHREQHFGGQLRQSTHGGRRRPVASRRQPQVTRGCGRY